jgi:SRSO17 transposase
VLGIDDSGDRKDGTEIAHVGHQWLGRYGKTDNNVVAVTTVWANERLYHPVEAPYTPAKHFAKGKRDSGFRTKLAIGADLAVRPREAGFTFRAVAADSAYGDQDGVCANAVRRQPRPSRAKMLAADDGDPPVQASGSEAGHASSRPR